MSKKTLLLMKVSMSTAWKQLQNRIILGWSAAKFVSHSPSLVHTNHYFYFKIGSFDSSKATVLKAVAVGYSLATDAIDKSAPNLIKLH